MITKNDLLSFLNGIEMLDNKKKFGIATKAIHAGQEPDKLLELLWFQFTHHLPTFESRNIKVLNTQELKTLPGQHMKDA